jgi:RNA polymerase sigma-32 factor
MKKQIKTSLPALDDGLARYVRRAQSFPILSAEEEYEYAKNFAENHDKLSAEKLISSHLRLVVSMAYELKDYGIPISELISSGNVGLMHALGKFNPEKGFRFSTYATFWIRAEMYDFILGNWSVAKIGGGAAEKKIFFNLARAKRALGIMDSGLSDEQARMIADKLNVPADDVHSMNTRMHSRDLSLNAVKYDDGGEMMDFLADDGAPFEDELENRELYLKKRSVLQKHLAGLPSRDRDIFAARRLADPPKTLEELSKEHGISRERIRQIEERTYNKLKAAILEDGE